MVWLRVEGAKGQGAPGGRALFTLRGSTPEGPKGVAAAFKGEASSEPSFVAARGHCMLVICRCWLQLGSSDLHREHRNSSLCMSRAAASRALRDKFAPELQAVWQCSISLHLSHTAQHAQPLSYLLHEQGSSW